MSIVQARLGRAEAPLSESASAIARRWWVIVLCGLMFGIAVLGISFLQTPVYRSTATLYVTSGTVDGNAQSAYQGSLASQQRVLSYAELAKSEVVLADAVSRAGRGVTVADVKDEVFATSSRDTVLLYVSADAGTPESAARMANAVADAMSEYVSTLEKPSDGGVPLAKLTVVSAAVPDGSAVSPQTSRNVVVGLLIGLIVGLAGVVVAGRLDTRIHTQEDLEGLDVGVLSVVPSDPSLRAASTIDFGAGGQSASAEAFRRLRTNLQFARVDDPVRVVAVTSAGASEGKSTTSINLASALAESGRRVLLVDADMRRPRVAEALGLNSSIGLTNYLRGDGDLSEFIQPTRVQSLDVVAAGPIPPNPAELLGSRRSEDGFRSMGELYDYVVVDTPPVLPVTDAAVVGQWVDACLFVVRAGKCGVPTLREALGRMDAAELDVVGLVLNEANVPGGAYYAYGYGAYENVTAPESANSSQ